MNSVTLTLRHIDETPNSTLSELMLGRERICYILEDGHRDVKQAGQTRIPAGVYEIVPRKVGGFFNDYSKRFNHGFVPWLIAVPNFTYILIHIGNWVFNTRGCLLTGTEYTKTRDGDFMVMGSTDAYLHTYRVIKDIFDDGHRLFIEIDRGQSEPSPDQNKEEVREFDHGTTADGIASDSGNTDPQPAPAPTQATHQLPWFLLWLKMLMKRF